MIIKWNKNFWNEDAISKNLEKGTSTNGNSKIRITNRNLNTLIDAELEKKALEIHPPDEKNEKEYIVCEIIYNLDNLLQTLLGLRLYYENDPGFFKNSLNIDELENKILEIQKLKENNDSENYSEIGGITLYKWNYSSGRGIAFFSDLYKSLREVYLPYAIIMNGEFVLEDEKIKITFYSSVIEPKNIITYKNKNVLSENEEKRYRVGYSLYRESLLKEFGGSCPFTKTKYVIASHLKPWAETCDEGRWGDHVDKNNGIPLTPTLDKYLNDGLISFDDSGELIVSKLLSDKDIELLLRITNFKEIEKIKLQNSYMTEGRKSFIKYHREKVFNN